VPVFWNQHTTCGQARELRLDAGRPIGVSEVHETTGLFRGVRGDGGPVGVLRIDQEQHEIELPSEAKQLIEFMSHDA
jgi:hypothetical protein